MVVPSPKPIRTINRTKMDCDEASLEQVWLCPPPIGLLPIRSMRVNKFRK